MKNIILIDDLSNQGWKSVLTKSIVKNSGKLDAFTTYDLALKRIETKADLIFLDVRLTEEDHFKNVISELTGFKILQKIKEDFCSPNFSTPIILLTASNKIWIIEEFKQYGIDSFYIKEHPDFGFTKEYSRENFERLQSNFLFLIEKGAKRYEVWYEIKQIIDKLNLHKYFHESSGYSNIKNRIIDKLKLGYANLFSEQNLIEIKTLKKDNESIAFIIFWSIFEEIVKGFSEKNNWDKTNNYEFSGQWRFRNNNSFISREQNILTITPFYDKVTRKEIEKTYELSEFEENNYTKGFLNLSEQVYALLYLYGIKERKKFQNLNDFRNEIDYIHSSVKTIYKDSLTSQENQKITYDYIKTTLGLISTILNYPT